MPAPPLEPADSSQGAGPAAGHGLARGIGLLQATSLNVANMVGVGPFITIPLFVASMGGPQALVGWIVAAVLVLCDGLVWSELGAAMPGSGGTYHFLREIYGRYRGGRLIAFLFIWQFLISGTLELASGYIGASDYLGYALPDLKAALEPWGISNTLSVCAAAAALAISVALCRHVASLAWLAVVLCAGAMLTVLIVIGSGLWNFDASLLTFPPDAFRLDATFASGLGGAMLIAIYDYLGYYNVCHMGDEVVQPEKNIPRAVILSVLIVAAIYMTMNIAILGVVPWERAMKSENVAAEFMEVLYGRNVAVGFTFFIIWTALASTFVMTMGYSRILYAAARNGDFFSVFSWLHPRGRYPGVALLSLGALTAVFCFIPLQVVIDTAVIVRIFVQFLGQIFGLHLLRTTRPDVKLPFRMWLYPLPSLIATVGWLFILVAKYDYLPAALAVLGSGAVIYPLWRAIVGSPPAADKAAT
jgi:amino acid transporter